MALDQNEIDLREVTLSLSINGQLKTFSSPMGIKSTGKINANPLESEIEIKIANVSKSDQDYLLTACSPYNKNPTPKVAVLSAGRASVGTNIVFQGNITSCNPTQPPDIELNFKCQAHQYIKGNIVAASQPASVAMSQIAKQVAADCGLSCNFQATDKNIANYSFTGGALKQVSKINDFGGVAAWVDGDTLYVTDLNVPLKAQIRVLNLDTGLIGIPKTTEQGVQITYLLDNTSKAGGALQLEFKIYPALNGNYRIFTLGWDIASREVPFYWIADCKRIDQSGAVVIPKNVPKRKGRK